MIDVDKFENFNVTFLFNIHY